MNKPLVILLAGRAGSELESVGRELQQVANVDVSTRVLTEADSDPLAAVDDASWPDLLIYVVAPGQGEGLDALSGRPGHERPLTLVAGPDGDIALVKAAMRAGARDYVALPLSASEFAVTLAQIEAEVQAGQQQHEGNITVVVNAKGGSGASVVATNLAHISAVEGRRTILVDMDLQFGAIPVYLKLQPDNGLVRALQTVEKLDRIALEGLVQRHPSGLHVLAASQNELILSQDIPESCVAALFRLLSANYDEIVVDLPRQIDAVTSMIMQNADKVVVMLEASLVHIRDAKRLLYILRDILGISEQRIRIVVNRYDRNGAVQQSDVKTALAGHDVRTLPSDFRRVNDSVNFGSPLYAAARNAPVTKGLIQLTHDICGISTAKRGRQAGLFRWIHSSKASS